MQCNQNRNPWQGKYERNWPLTNLQGFAECTKSMNGAELNSSLATCNKERLVGARTFD